MVSGVRSVAGKNWAWPSKTPSVTVECRWGCSLREDPDLCRNATAPNLEFFGAPGLCLRRLVSTARMKTRRTPLNIPLCQDSCRLDLSAGSWFFSTLERKIIVVGRSVG